MSNAQTWCVATSVSVCAIELTHMTGKSSRHSDGSSSILFCNFEGSWNVQKTVKRRLQKMIEEKALFVIPSWNPKALDGAIIADLVVFYANPGSKPISITKSFSV